MESKYGSLVAVPIVRRANASAPPPPFSRLLKKSDGSATNEEKESRPRFRRINLAPMAVVANIRFAAGSRKSFFSSLLGVSVHQEQTSSLIDPGKR
jgi:hypothetical protein